jgi:G:T/U-mismatch repair DNA glycosylase
MQKPYWRQNMPVLLLKITRQLNKIFKTNPINTIMQNIKHQLSNQRIYTPTWEVRYLLLGTFNPEGGDSVRYYYGRHRNQTWKILSEIFCDELNPNSDDFFDKIKKHKISFMDIIHKVNVPLNMTDMVIGSGYKDSNIINKSVIRTYRTEAILDLIKDNPQVNVFSTWGIGSSLQEWNIEVNKIKSIIPLVSPSMAAKVPKGAQKFNYMLNDWKNKLNYSCNKENSL